MCSQHGAPMVSFLSEFPWNPYHPTNTRQNHQNPAPKCTSGVPLLRGIPAEYMCSLHRAPKVSKQLSFLIEFPWNPYPLVPPDKHKVTPKSCTEEHNWCAFAVRLSLCMELPGDPLSWVLCMAQLSNFQVLSCEETVALKLPKMYH